MLLELLFLAIALALLIFGADFLVRGAAALAQRLGMAPVAVGLTVVAYGTSTPELLVSLGAALKGNPGIAVGNVVGSNIVNICVIAGLAALICPMRVQWQLIKLDAPLMIGVTVLALLFLADAEVSRAEGLILVGLLAAYTIFNLWQAKRTTSAEVQAEMEGEVPKPTGHPAWDVAFILGGLVLLVGGSELLVVNAVKIAQAMGVSDAVIGLTVVALGTSTPELAASVMAALRKHADIALGNVIGSNIFNILGVMGGAAAIQPMAGIAMTPLDLGCMLVTAVLFWPLLYTGKTVQRWEGGLLLGLWLVYLAIMWPKG